MFSKSNAVVGIVVVLMMSVALYPFIFSPSRLQADPPSDVLFVLEEEVSVGAVLDTGMREGDECVMPHGALEVEVQVSIEEPSAGVTLRLTDTCNLIVESKRRTYARTDFPIDPSSAGPDEAIRDSLPCHTSGSIGRSTTPTDRYDAEAKSEWSDFAGLDTAATFVRYTYDESSNGFSFYGSPEEQCVKFGWWKTERCRMDGQSAGSSSITATAHGRFSIKITGGYRHSQEPTFTARRSGRGTARCWSSTNRLAGLHFTCDGNLHHG